MAKTARPQTATADIDLIERGRDAVARRAWEDAYHWLREADGKHRLQLEDLERLTFAAGLTGRDDELLKGLERIHQHYLEQGNNRRAGLAAFWLAFRLSPLGETGRATGWLARAERLIEGEGDCVERGYLKLAVAQRSLAAGDFEGMHRAAETAATIGDRFGEKDLAAFARNVQGLALIRLGEVARGLALLDEAMVATAAGEISPVFTGLIYCSVIGACQRIYAFDRAREWTDALTAWCEAQPQLVAFSGYCLVHRAEIMQLNGAWKAAIEEALRATSGKIARGDSGAVAAAFYQAAEVHRLEGDFAQAEEAYRQSSERGGETQPGLALLRLAQGKGDIAAAALRRVLAAATDRLQRTRFLPAAVETFLAIGEIEEAHAACVELDAIASEVSSDALDAIAAHARGAVALVKGDPAAALSPLRSAFAVWQHQLGAPYLAARLRVLLGEACRALGDEDSAGLEFASARAVFSELGARPDLVRLDRIAVPESKDKAGPLTARELEVLRLVATGKTNKAIANELSLSDKTVDRHVSNIFVKLDVPTRAAATAYAYEHKLI